MIRSGATSAERVQIIAATLLTYAATTPCSRSSLGVAVELKLHCAPSGKGGSKTIGCKVRLHQAPTWNHVSRRGLEEELCLKAVALLCVVADEEENEEEESDLLVAAALKYRSDAGTDSTIAPPKPAIFFNERFMAARHNEGYN